MTSVFKKYYIHSSGKMHRIIQQTNKHHHIFQISDTTQLLEATIEISLYIQKKMYEKFLIQDRKEYSE